MSDDASREFVYWLVGIVSTLIGVIFLMVNAKIDRNARNIEIHHESTEKKFLAVDDRMKEAEQSIAAHRESSAERYVTRSEIEGKLDKLEKLMYRLLGKYKGIDE